ncbi:uncharacterized protein I303_107179 [Kwoniella dejecticola CBS 10117]|uniref:Uncharacterized protein n=1 Tax=Kwoniella dejecticola CBS 10117 TaxID=1296121 RepID=A0A1A5ZYY7_9TREE|nr:uncharacterized protein I303_06581 [Kwoniella dejecticola CBS 10117]OBR83022.1 hypothetical protein I303_06581 [Kwoniella dejecticola CBS 10117]
MTDPSAPAQSEVDSDDDGYDMGFGDNPFGFGSVGDKLSQDTMTPGTGAGSHVFTGSVETLYQLGQMFEPATIAAVVRSLSTNQQTIDFESQQMIIKRHNGRPTGIYYPGASGETSRLRDHSLALTGIKMPGYDNTGQIQLQDMTDSRWNLLGRLSRTFRGTQDQFFPGSPVHRHCEMTSDKLDRLWTQPIQDPHDLDTTGAGRLMRWIEGHAESIDDPYNPNYTAYLHPSVVMNAGLALYINNRASVG